MAMGERLDLGILGPLSAGVDGQRLKITSARQRTILALLVLRPDAFERQVSESVRIPEGRGSPR